jgi:hypothetical protein
LISSGCFDEGFEDFKRGSFSLMKVERGKSEREKMLYFIWIVSK